MQVCLTFQDGGNVVTSLQSPFTLRKVYVHFVPMCASVCRWGCIVVLCIRFSTVFV